MYIYVLNLPAAYPSSTLANHLRVLFARYGAVSDVVVKKELDGPCVSYPYAFVEMGTKDEAQAAIRGLNASDFSGRRLVVAAALPDPTPPARWTPVSWL